MIKLPHIPQSTHILSLTKTTEVLPCIRASDTHESSVLVDNSIGESFRVADILKCDIGPVDWRRELVLVWWEREC
jgi:hypothetical protein